MFDWNALREVIVGGRRLVIFLHDNPDPDAIAAGWLLAKLAESLDKRAVIVYGGRLGRAENRAMVQLLKIPLRRLDKTGLRWLGTDRYALIDTQPGTGNNSFPDKRRRCHIVIDHHPLRKDTRAQFVDVRPEFGCSTTLMLEYSLARGMELDSSLATAVIYALISETQDLGREATRADREAYTRVYPLARLTILGRIRHPARKRSYYQTLARALQQVQISRNTCVCHIGPVQHAEVVAEVADLLAAMERITWCLVTGLQGDQMVLSMRSTRPQARAEQVMRRVLGRQGKGGGHGQIAGGLMPLGDPASYPEQCTRVTERFLKHLRRRVTERLHPLLEEPEREAPVKAPAKEPAKEPAKIPGKEPDKPAAGPPGPAEPGGSATVAGAAVLAASQEPETKNQETRSKNE